MKINNKICLCIFIMCSHFSAALGATDNIWNYLTQSYTEIVTYQAPTSQNLETAKTLFKKHLTDLQISQTDIDSWKNLGFKLSIVESSNSSLPGSFIMIMENTPAGGGFYLIKRDNNFHPNIIEAPHRPSDLYTHEIAYKLFREGNFSALAVNTVNRSSVDMGKAVSSYYNAFTIAVAESFSNAKLLQLHAFDASDHEMNADMILSSTKKEENPAYNQIATCLRQNLIGTRAFLIMQYPKDVQALGGTLNINAKNFYAANPSGSFFHVETSKALRDELRQSLGLRSAVIQCFIGS